MGILFRVARKEFFKTNQSYNSKVVTLVGRCAYTANQGANRQYCLNCLLWVQSPFPAFQKVERIQTKLSGLQKMGVPEGVREIVITWDTGDWRYGTLQQIWFVR